MFFFSDDSGLIKYRIFIILAFPLELEKQSYFLEMWLLHHVVPGLALTPLILGREAKEVIKLIKQFG